MKRKIVLVLVMAAVLTGMGIAFLSLCAKRLCGRGWMWWEHGSARCV